MPDYVYNKFFGLVVDNQVDIIVNPPMNDDDIMEVQVYLKMVQIMLIIKQ